MGTFTALTELTSLLKMGIKIVLRSRIMGENIMKELRICLNEMAG